MAVCDRPNGRALNTLHDHPKTRQVEQGGFLLFLALVSLALLAIVLPFLQPMLWAALAAILFQPLYRWFLAKRPLKTTQAALASMLVILFAVVMPALWIGSAVVDEAAGLFVALRWIGLDVPVAGLIAALLGFALRAMAILRGLGLPIYRQPGD